MINIKNLTNNELVNEYNIAKKNFINATEGTPAEQEADRIVIELFQEISNRDLDLRDYTTNETNISNKNYDHVNFRFVASTRCLIVENEQSEDYLFYKFYGEFDEVHREVKADIQKYLNEHSNIKSYSQDLHELDEVEETNTIQVFFADGNNLMTRIRGTFESIVNHYRNNNESYCRVRKENIQVKKIQYIDSCLLDDKSSLCYLFIDDGTGLLA